jgi:GT2 family glycosyltransferase
MVRSEFPAVRVERFETSAGLVGRRNDAARLAHGPVVVSIDDDAVFTSPGIVAQTLADFDDPRVAAVAMPYVDVPVGPEEHQRAPDPVTCWVAPVFRGTAYAVRRDVFLDLGGFRALIVHQGEEHDFALRLLGAGYAVRLGRAEPIHHFVSPNRDLTRMAVYGRRNELLVSFTRFPLPAAVAAMTGYTLKALRAGVREGDLATTLRGLRFGLASCWRLRGERDPLPWRALWLDRRLRRHRALPIGAVGSLLRAPDAEPAA